MSLQNFAKLFDRLDETQSSKRKKETLIKYFSQASPADAVWALFFLSGGRLKRHLSSKKLRDFLPDYLEIPPWIVEDCYQNVGDGAETISMLISAKKNGLVSSSKELHEIIENGIVPLKDLDRDDQRKKIETFWSELPSDSLMVFNKLMTGGFRVGVSELTVARAIAEWTSQDRDKVIHKLTGDWVPSVDFWEKLIDPNSTEQLSMQPYPFLLANQVVVEDIKKSDIGRFSFEWKWDGIRIQVIVRNNKVLLWSRGQQDITHQFPDLAERALSLPDGTVLDGELIAYSKDTIGSFNDLQKRLGKKAPSAKFISENPTQILAYDLIEHQGKDIRTEPLRERRERLTNVLQDHPFSLSESFHCSSWDEAQTCIASARSRKAEGLMIKDLSASYEVGRKRGAWWKWKTEPLTIDAVLLYAQLGSGKRAGRFTDYTFGVWNQEKIVTFAKAYSGLDLQEIEELDKWIRQNTLDRFGPVRSVKPNHVFELGFEGISMSKRHKSGFTVRFPRILRWRKDKPAEEADNLESLKTLYDEYSQ